MKRNIFGTSLVGGRFHDIPMGGSIGSVMPYGERTRSWSPPRAPADSLIVHTLQQVLAEMNSTDLATENQMLKAKIAALTELCDEFDALRDELSKRVERLRRMIPKYRHLRKALKEAHSKSRAIEAELAELKKIMAENEKNRGDFDPGHKGKPFVEHANRLDKIGQTDAALDLIYDRIDTLLVKGKFEEVDSVLRDADPKRLSVDILLGLLTSTLPARTKLSTRAKFFAEVEREIRRRDQWEDGLLTGLESQP